MAAFLRWFLLAFLGVGVIAPFSAVLFEPMAQGVLSKFGVDSSAWVDPMLTLLTSWWGLLSCAVVGGAVVGAWLHHFLTKIDARRKAAPSLAARTELRLQFRSELSPFEVLNQNVWRWYTTNIIAQDRDGTQKKVAQQIVVTFDHAASTGYRSLTCSNPKISLQVLDCSERSAVISSTGDLTDSTVGIIFSKDPV